MKARLREALALLSFVGILSGPASARAEQIKPQPRSAVPLTGEAPDRPGLGQKLSADLASANAAAKAGLTRVKQGIVSPAALQANFKPTPTHAAGNLALKMPCDRSLFNVEGAAANFQIQPGQLILLNGCFAGAPNAEVRIAGNFPPYGYLLLNIQDRGDSYFYGQVPDVIGVPDQSVSISIRFFDGTTSNARNGYFYAKRQSWDSTSGQAICHAVRVDGAEHAPDQHTLVIGCPGNNFGPGGIDVWSARDTASGYRIVKFWWTAATTSNGLDFPNAAPIDVRWSNDGTTVLVSHRPLALYGATHVRIEGPAGASPF